MGYLKYIPEIISLLLGISLWILLYISTTEYEIRPSYYCKYNYLYRDSHGIKHCTSLKKLKDNCHYNNCKDVKYLMEDLPQYFPDLALQLALVYIVLQVWRFITPLFTSYQKRFLTYMTILGYFLILTIGAAAFTLTLSTYYHPCFYTLPAVHSTIEFMATPSLIYLGVLGGLGIVIMLFILIYFGHILGWKYRLLFYVLIGCCGVGLGITTISGMVVWLNVLSPAGVGILISLFAELVNGALYLWGLHLSNFSGLHHEIKQGETDVQLPGNILYIMYI